jgi:DNA-binding response OmpR family regulator
VTLPKQRILLVESNNDSAELVCWYLIKAGYQLTATSSYGESLALARTRQFKLYLLGEGFEDRTNLDLCQQIRTVDSNTPIIFCSAWAYPTDIDRGISSGAQAYLTKPCDLDELAETIKQLIGETTAQTVGKSARLRRRANEGASNARRGALRYEYLLSSV